MAFLAQSATKEYVGASRLRETFLKRYIAERTNEAEIRPEQETEKAKSCWENVWTEIQLEGP